MRTYLFSELVAAIKECRDLEAGRKLHVDAVAARCDTDKYVAAALITMYSKCRSMALAREVFERLVFRDVVTWTCLIQGYVENGEGKVALDLFSSMDYEPDHVTYLAALKACVGLGQVFLEKGIAIHERVKGRALDSNVVLASTLMDMYSKFGCMRLAREVFEGMIHKDVVLWNCLFMGYVENGESSVVLELFNSMDCQPDEVSYLAVVKACADLASVRESERELFLEKGIAIHRQVRERGVESNVILSNTLVDMYGKCGEMQLAREAFERMIYKDVVTWNCLILGYVENGESLVALELFESMDCEPTHVTYLTALRACIESESETILEKGVSIHRRIKERGLDSNISVVSTLVDMYRKCGKMELAREVFEGMIHKDVVTWTSLLLGYVENGESSLALELFMSMDCEPDTLAYITALKACGCLAEVHVGRSIHGEVCRRELLGEDTVVATSLVDFYGRCGCMASAVGVFNGMHSPNIMSWTALIAGYSSVGDSHEVFRLAREVEEGGVGMHPVTFVCILTACSHAGMVNEGEMYFESMEKYGISPGLEHYNCMVDMLGRANRFGDALSLVDSMPFEANEVTWTSLLSACRKWKNVKAGKVAFDALVARGAKGAASAYAMMGDIYGNRGMWEDWERMRMLESFEKP